MKPIVTASLLVIMCAAPALAVGPFDSDAEIQAPIREGEKPVIPLDTKDPTYNIWQELRDFSKDPKREPGAGAACPPLV